MKSNNKYILLNNSFSLRNINKIEQSFLSSNNNKYKKISKYKNFFNIKKLKTKTIKHKSIPLLYLTSLENKINDNIYKEYTKNNLSARSTFQNKISTFYNSNTKINVNSIIQNFELNKKSAKMLIDREKKMKLNSLNNVSKENIEFILSDGNYNEENEKHRTINNKSNSYRLCWKLIKLFNKKTDNILNSSENNTILKKIKNKFNTTEIIDSFKKAKYSENDLKKLKQRYNEANEIIEKMNEEKIRKAKQLEKEFYQLKNEEDSKQSEIKFRKILRKSIFSLSKINKEYKRPTNIKRLSIRPIHEIKKIELNRTDEKLLKANEIYSDYFNKKIKLNAKEFDENINKLIISKNNIKNSNYLDGETKRVKMMSEDILRIKEIKKIKNKNKDDEFRNKYTKLKDGMNKCEDEYYRVCVFNNKNFSLSFLKPRLKMKTIKQCQRIQVCYFGMP